MNTREGNCYWKRHHIEGHEKHGYLTSQGLAWHGGHTTLGIIRIILLAQGYFGRPGELGQTVNICVSKGMEKTNVLW
jgi:hypothetical protein